MDWSCSMGEETRSVETLSQKSSLSDKVSIHFRWLTRQYKDGFCPGTDRQTDRQMDGRTDRQTDRQTGRQADGRTYRQTDRETDGQTGRQGDMNVPNWRSIIWSYIVHSTQQTQHLHHNTTSPPQHNISTTTHLHHNTSPPQHKISTTTHLHHNTTDSAWKI